MSHVGLPLFDEPLVPFQGATAVSVEASRSGAAHALKSRSAKLERLRALWSQVPMTMQEVSEATGWPLASVCSLKACLDVEAVDTVTQEWADGRTTMRTRWRLRR